VLSLSTIKCKATPAGVSRSSFLSKRIRHIIPDSAKEKPIMGAVVATGKGKIKDDGTVLAPDVKKGDKILFGKYSGTEVKIEEEEYLILREDDILGVIEK